ncbi:divisome protein SepX/GlpR [Nocardia brevicatena]|uniref:divisome protein SepX/GlpR n=1 Tax=Nocardia brevicatena TaxID=37327 RepID=UPI00030F9F3C|nr:gephyrin-like molybdotransferase receptor GlpR [Nocardia brevicatena]
MPNSILWIGLVVLWVFVLFPILADRHPRIRRTTDTALATRVLHRGGSKRRAGSGHARKRSTRPYRKRHHSKDAEDRMTTSADDPVTEADEERSGTGVGVALADPPDTADPWFATDDDADRDEDPAIPDPDPVTHDRADTVPARIPPARPPALRDPDVGRPHDLDDDFVPTRRGRGGFDPEADAAARAARYTFRQRAVLALVLGALLCGGLAIAVATPFWWGCGGAVTVLVAYLAYLRRQVRMEEEIRRRRSARLARDRRSAEAPPVGRGTPASHRGMDRDTARALLRRSELLEPDDEDPVFEHLETYDATTARTVRHRAAGGDIRRAAGA